MPLSLLNGDVYCPRRAALKIVEAWQEANDYTERGRIFHEHPDTVARHRALVSGLESTSDQLP